MMYSFAGVVQKANDENDANEQIDDVYRSICAHLYGPMHRMGAVFETDDLDHFLKELNKTINDFLQNYKEI